MSAPQSDADRAADDRATVSVIIPAHNAAEHLPACLAALAVSEGKHECIVADDGSTDQTARMAREARATVITLQSNCGPSLARNAGAAAASGNVLLFVDADVCVHTDSVERVRRAFEADSELAALFGSYDDKPKRKDFVSEYRNLMHHFVHQRARREATTFWSGFGAVRKSAFDAVGGFDPSFPRPAIEDIELGHRLHRSGYKIILDPTLQVTHLKEWTFLGMIANDVQNRAIPWTQLILRDTGMPNDLNVSISQRISVALVFILAGTGIVGSILHAKVLLAPLLAVFFLMLAHYEVELTATRRYKGTIATFILLLALAATSLWSDQRLVFVVTLLAFLLLILRRHLHTRETVHRRWVGGFAGAFLLASMIFVALQPGANLPYLLFLAIGGVVILLNASFYAVLAAKRGRIYAIAAVPFHILFFLYSGIAFLIAASRHYTGKFLSSRHSNAVN